MDREVTRTHPQHSTEGIAAAGTLSQSMQPLEWPSAVRPLPPPCLPFVVQGFAQFTRECDQASFKAAVEEAQRYIATGDWLGAGCGGWG